MHGRWLLDLPQTIVWVLLAWLMELRPQDFNALRRIAGAANSLDLLHKPDRLTA